MGAVKFEKAAKSKARLRLALDGPAGSGKTYTALRIASALGKKIAVRDSEHGSASKYADSFTFDVVEPKEHSPADYTSAIESAAASGYDVLILDSLSHAWSGKGGALEQVDKAATRSRSQNTYTAWRDVTPLHNRMIDAILSAPMHIIATMRTKTKYELEENKQGKKVPRKIGMEPIQRDGVEFEFDVVADLDMDHNFIVSKTRCPALDQYVAKCAGEEEAKILMDWLSDGTTLRRPEPASVSPKKKADDKPKDTKRLLWDACGKRAKKFGVKPIDVWNDVLLDNGIAGADQIKEGDGKVRAALLNDADQWEPKGPEAA